MHISETEERAGNASLCAPSGDVAVARDRGLDSIRIGLERDRMTRSAQLSSLNQDMAEAIAAGDHARRHITEILIRTTEAALSEFDGALARMQAGAYGRCERCNEAIPADRLEIRPTSRLCFPCQRAIEMLD